MSGARRFLVRVSLSFLVVGVLVLTSVVGSFLNRGVGGFIYFGGPRNESDPHYVDWYWSRQVLSKAYFALPTGLLVVSICDIFIACTVIISNINATCSCYICACVCT